ncbi:DUF3349 domain-containing protein [Mycolicibacterium brumae]|nr:DUF3349 domain-containing protein [Mycolicibacterium brumae]MCV7191615.1 DUF3349 domain-containing protein [Mycolicibacterium brumae]RWA20531.1 hypothetical protein MBRU_02415 [Mycolicibacterium brumae DSM 44177]UWW07627.1 DUF3349 domain-containing protein [Mycolicibacterium brumae]
MIDIVNKAVTWVRTGYPPEAPRHGYLPLLALGDRHRAFRLPN